MISLVSIRIHKPSWSACLQPTHISSTAVFDKSKLLKSLLETRIITGKQSTRTGRCCLNSSASKHQSKNIWNKTAACAILNSIWVMEKVISRYSLALSYSSSRRPFGDQSPILCFSRDTGHFPREDSTLSGASPPEGVLPRRRRLSSCSCLSLLAGWPCSSQPSPGLPYAMQTAGKRTSHCPEPRTRNGHLGSVGVLLVMSGKPFPPCKYWSLCPVLLMQHYPWWSAQTRCHSYLVRHNR